MTEDRLLQLIDAWGADPNAYPETERAAAAALLAAHPERFAAALVTARALDAVLARVPDVMPSRALEESLIVSAPRPRAPEANVRWPRVVPWAPASGLAAISAGLFMGLMVAPAESAASGTDDVTVILEEVLGFDPAAYEEVLGE